MRLVAGLLLTISAAAQLAPEKQALLQKVVREDFEQRREVREHAYLARLAAGLQAGITVKLIEASEVLGATLPGGWVYVSRGLVTVAETEAELAGVVAHLASHREGGMILLTSSGLCSRFSALIPGIGNWQSRERQADASAIAMLRDGGFDPSGLAGFFGRRGTVVDEAPAEGVVTRSEFEREKALLAPKRVRRPRPTLYR